LTVSDKRNGHATVGVANFMSFDDGDVATV